MENQAVTITIAQESHEDILVTLTQSEDELKVSFDFGKSGTEEKGPLQSGVFNMLLKAISNA